MSLLPSPPRPRTLFEVIRDLSDHQTENHVLLTQVVATQATTATNQSTLHATLGQVQAQLATTLTAVAAMHQQIADGITYWQTNVVTKPTAVTVGGKVHTEVEERFTLAETRKLSPVALLAILNPLYRLELRLADLRLAEDRAGREAALADYALAVREFDEVIQAHRYLRGLKAQAKALPLKLPGEAKEAIDTEILEKISILHAIAASAVALYAATQTP